MIKLAIVLPCFNEEQALPSSIRRLTALFDDLQRRSRISPDSFMLFVNDGSSDSSWQLIEQAHADDKRVRGVNLAGNRGHQNALLAGLECAMDACDAAITMDADLQDSIESIELMLNKYEQGYDIVCGVKVSRTADPFFKRLTAHLFYKLQQSMGVKSIYNHADFRLMSRRAVKTLFCYPERNFYLRGVIPLLGYRIATVDDYVGKREAGVSKYNLRKMLGLAFDGITSFSIAPIHFILGLGMLFLFICLGVLGYVVASYIEHSVVPGWASLMLSVWFVGGVVLLCLGVVGLYVGKIYIEVKRRPRYNIEKILPEEKPSVQPRADRPEPQNHDRD